jgi:hypothetical protein
MNATTSADPRAPSSPPADDAAPVQAILDALRGLRFGSVTVIVQDGVIVQVERVEKKRLARPTRRAAQP